MPGCPGLQINANSCGPSRLSSQWSYHKRDLRFGDPRNDGTRAYSLLVNAILRGHFGSLHPGHCQDVFHYLKTRCCLFCWCASYIWSCFFYLYLFAELLSEWRDHVRAEKLLSSAAKIVILIIHQQRLYTGLMANSTSDLLLFNSISTEMLSLQTQESLSELG